MGSYSREDGYDDNIALSVCLLRNWSEANSKSKISKELNDCWTVKKLDI